MPEAESPGVQIAVPPGRRLRILHLGRFHRTRTSGGIERHVRELLKALAPYVDADNLVAADSLRGDHYQEDGYRVHRAPSFGLLYGVAISPSMIAEARELNRIHEFDIVHLHFPDPLAQIVASSLPRRIKRVVTWHSDIVRQRRLLGIYGPWMRRFVGDADAVIAATRAHFDNSQQIAAARSECRHIIPYGLDYERFETPQAHRRATEIAALANARGRLIFSVGRHVYYKGFPDLIRALQHLPDAHLALAGEGPLTGELRELAHALGVAERVSFLGYLDDDEITAWYRACDIFCLPSSLPAEAFGLVQLEAMACGKPVVCTRLGTGVNIVCRDNETGLTAEPGDPRSLADRLRRLMDDPDLRARLGNEGRRVATTEYSVATMAQRTLALYRRLAGA